MTSGKFSTVFLLWILLLTGVTSYAQSPKEEKHLLVSLRMIGHELLLNSGDSASRVFPIEKEGDSYKIQFASAFAFNPGDLAATVDHLVNKTKIAGSYLVEVKRCENDEVVYSYEKGDSAAADLMPCGPRFQSKACYVVYFTILEKIRLNAGVPDPAVPVERVFSESKERVSTTTSVSSSEGNTTDSATAKEKSHYSLIAVPIGSAFAFIGLLVYFRRRRRVAVSAHTAADPGFVQMGDTRFDQKNMLLIRGKEHIELSSKESDLLSLLYAHVNQTIEREQILKIVWGDEGDYIGRTLDVFVSKLRKKLEADPRVKIVNIRGIGYKFIVN